MHRLYTLEIKDLSAFRAICCSFCSKRGDASVSLMFLISKMIYATITQKLRQRM